MSNQKVLKLIANFKSVFPGSKVVIESWRGVSMDPEELINGLKLASISGRWIKRVKSEE